MTWARERVKEIVRTLRTIGPISGTLEVNETFHRALHDYMVGFDAICNGPLTGPPPDPAPYDPNAEFTFRRQVTIRRKRGLVESTTPVFESLAGEALYG